LAGTNSVEQGPEWKEEPKTSKVKTEASVCGVLVEQSYFVLSLFYTECWGFSYFPEKPLKGMIFFNFRLEKIGNKQDKLADIEY
jgi:hypothetical protein